ncbi:MAG TPA: hypothetical protein VH207_13110 [Chthoniobacterales bacterium]|nr:hypothetical protein [Chthoniobacterales bacterium]
MSIYKIATWLGGDVRAVEKHDAKLLPKDEDIWCAAVIKIRFSC